MFAILVRHDSCLKSRISLQVNFFLLSCNYFYQHFTSRFCVDFLVPKLEHKSCAKHFRTKKLSKKWLKKCHMLFKYSNFTQTLIDSTLAVSLERYFAVCRPLWIRIRRCHPATYIVIVLVFAFGFNIPKFLEFEVRIKVFFFESSFMAMAFCVNNICNLRFQFVQFYQELEFK